MAGIWEQFKQDYDPQAVGMQLLASTGDPRGTGYSLGSALMAGRQARLAEAQARADAAAAKRAERVKMAETGVYETADGQFGRRQVKQDPTGGSYMVDMGPGGEFSTQQLYAPPAKPEEQKENYTAVTATNAEGKPVVYMVNKYNPRDYYELGGAAGGSAGGGTGAGRLLKTEAQALDAAQASAYPLNELRQVITDPARMEKQAGPVDRFSNFVNMKVLGVGTPATADANILSSGSIETIMGDISKLVPASDADIKMLREAKLPPPGDRKAWVNYYNRQVAEYKRILSKYPQGREYLSSPDFMQALTPISMETRPDAQKAPQAPKFLGYE